MEVAVFAAGLVTGAAAIYVVTRRTVKAAQRAVDDAAEAWMTWLS